MSVVEANVAIMNGLYTNWSITNPAKDTVGWNDPSGALHLLDSNDPTKIHFTTRKYGYAPLRVHPFWISSRRLPESFTPAAPGIPSKYLAAKTVLVDVAVLQTTKTSIEQAEQFYFNMIQEIKRIIRVNAPTLFAPNFVSVIVTSVNHDEAALGRNPPRVHAQMTVQAIDFEVTTS